MRRSPFYASGSFCRWRVEATFHGPSPSPAPTPRSIVNIPVLESAPFDVSSAAKTIQSCFRGFGVRRHRPLLHLRSIAKARKQLEELRLELDSPGFPLRLRESEKERLRFGESVMTIILRLDAIQCPVPEVRNQRKEAIKMAVKLQDDIDAIMMNRDDEIVLWRLHGPR